MSPTKLADSRLGSRARHFLLPSTRSSDISLAVYSRRFIVETRTGISTYMSLTSPRWQVRHYKEGAALVCFMLIVVSLTTWAVVQSQTSPAVSAGGAGSLQQESILRSTQKPRVPKSDGRPENANRAFTAAEISSSMRARRDQAWVIVQQVWEPIPVAGSKIPAWMTWYEEEDIAQLYRELIDKQDAKSALSPAEVSAYVTAVLKEHPFKDLQTSLSSARLGRVLRQFTFPGIPSLGPNRRPATGVIYYNTAYVRHLLENAETIARCDLAGFPKLSFPGSSILGSSPVESIGIDRLPFQLPPADPQNRWALCMNHEMPPDAIMIKVNWTPLIRYDSAGNGYVDEHAIDTSAKMASALSSLPSGRWIEIPWDEDSRAKGGIKAAGFRVTDEKGREWELRGMHIAKKNLRTWMWTSLFEAGGSWNWGADKPEALTQQWSPLVEYGMCTVSNFRENDPAPWSAYNGKGEHLQSLADAVKAVAKVMQGAQWCSNPYIETNMAFGNCVGCHQGSSETFLPTTVFEAGVKPANQTLDRLIPETLLRTTQMELPFNTSDFSFSFATNRSAFQEVIRQHRRLLTR